MRSGASSGVPDTPVPFHPFTHAHDVLLRPPGHDCRVWQTNRVSGTEREWDGAVHPPWRGEVLPWPKRGAESACPRPHEARTGLSLPHLPPRLIRSRLRPPLPLLALVRRGAPAAADRGRSPPAGRLGARRVRQDGRAGAMGRGRRRPVRLAAGRRCRQRPAALPPVPHSSSRRGDRRRSARRAVAAVAPPPVETRILPALAAAVASAEPFVLVIDDAHLVTNEVCWRVAGAAPRSATARAHLCLSGRKAALSRWRACGLRGACSS